MRTLCLGAATAFTLIAALPCAATANSRVGPPAGDIISAWVGHRLASQPADDALVADASLTLDMVNAPLSIYTGIRAVPFGFRGTVWNRVFATLSDRGTPLTRGTATEALAWDLGMTNGYPGVDDADNPAPDLGARWAGTQLAKAAVSEDIARRALALAGQGSFAVAASYAVAAQILADKLACFDQAQWASLGLRADVLQRFMLARSEADLRDYDLVYLVRLLQAELSTFHAGEMTSAGRREIPTALRVARVAATYRDMQGYVEDPCTDRGRERAGVASIAPTENTRHMCLVAATDRTILTWYQMNLASQVDPAHSNFVIAPAIRMARTLSPMRPMWLGAFDKALQVYGLHVEIVESLVADQVADDESSRRNADRYAQRRLMFLCDKEVGS
ncbi:hypothetical protein [Luteibacter sp.]|uniref:hypothetical protein n=1 Tax=Luteibacter sp. TaxID=1886636 RepID=UPI003F7E26E0